MSQHTIVKGICKVPSETFDYESAPEADPQIDTNTKFADIKWVFGWDPPLQSFFLQVHDAFVADVDANPVLWFGATADTQMRVVNDLVKQAQKYGLDIPLETQKELYREQGDNA